jgi:hypothetical protein
MDSILRTEWVGRLVLGAGPHPNDAHGRAAPAELHALADPLALPVLAERFLTQSTNTSAPVPSLSPFNFFTSYLYFLLGMKRIRTRVQRTSPDAVISTVPRTRESSGRALAVCQSPATWIVGRPGHAAGARV